MATTTIKQIYDKAPAAASGDDDILLIVQNEATKGVKLKNVTAGKAVNADYSAHLGTKAAPLEVGNRGVPVYLDKNGVPKPCDNIQPSIAKDTIAQSTDTGTVKFDRVFIISAPNEIVLTIGDGEYIGIEVKIINITDKTHIIRGTTARDGDSTLQAGQIQTVIWNGSKWEGLSCPRIGEVYMQYPQQEAPQDLFICTKWKLQDQYAGAFFRATGGNAAAFIEKTGNLIKQPDGLPNITGEMIVCGHGGLQSDSGCFYGNDYDRNGAGLTTSDDRRERHVFDASRSSSVYRNNHGEVTPANFTIRIWLRTA